MSDKFGSVQIKVMVLIVIFLIIGGILYYSFVDTEDETSGPEKALAGEILYTM